MKSDDRQRKKKKDPIESELEASPLQACCPFSHLLRDKEIIILAFEVVSWLEKHSKNT